MKHCIMERKKSAIIQLSLLAVIQWLSIVVIILNTSALNSMKISTENRQQGSIDAATEGPSFRDFASLILGSLSLILASSLLCLYLYLSMGLVVNSNHPILLSKRLLAAEIFSSLSIIALWTVVSGVVFSRFHEMSICQNVDFAQQLTTKVSFLVEPWNGGIDAKTCNTANAMITTGLVTICIWMIVLILSIYMYYYQLCEGSANNLLTSTFSVHPYDDQQNKNPNHTAARQPAGSSLREKYSPIINLQAAIVTKNSNKDLNDKLRTTTLFNNYRHSEISGRASTITNNVVFLNEGAGEDEEKGGNVEYSGRSSSIPSMKATNQSIEEGHGAFYAQEQQHLRTPELPSTSATTTARKYWDYFQFEPVNLNLMLPTPHELVGERKHDSFFYYS